MKENEVSPYTTPKVIRVELKARSRKDKRMRAQGKCSNNMSTFKGVGKHSYSIPLDKITREKSGMSYRELMGMRVNIMEYTKDESIDYAFHHEKDAPEDSILKERIRVQEQREQEHREWQKRESLRKDSNAVNKCKVIWQGYSLA